MIAAEVAEGVFLAASPIADLVSGSAAPEWARRAAEGMPDWRAREYLAVRALYAQLTAEVEETAAPALSSTPRGAPIVSGRPGLKVSLAHSAEMAAVALGRDRDVGVDVHEAGLPGRAMLRKCCPAEADRMAAAPEAGGRDFARVWAAQEACVKATGEGIAGCPWRIPVTAAAETGRWRELTWKQLTSRGSAFALCCAFSGRAEERR